MHRVHPLPCCTMASLLLCCSNHPEWNSGSSWGQIAAVTAAMWLFERWAYKACLNRLSVFLQVTRKVLRLLRSTDFALGFFLRVLLFIVRYYLAFIENVISLKDLQNFAVPYISFDVIHHWIKQVSQTKCLLSSVEVLFCLISFWFLMVACIHSSYSVNLSPFLISKIKIKHSWLLNIS